MKTLIIVILVLLALLFGALAYCYFFFCGPGGGEVLDVGEPKVWHVLGDGGGSGQDVNVLFLGDGFVTDDQLEVYRSAVYQLALGLISDEPFCNYADNLEFYRIDVRDEDSVFPDASCPSDCATLETLDSASPPLAAAPAAIEVRSGSATSDVNLGATRCWTTASSTLSPACYVFWTDTPGQDAAYELARRLPDLADIEVVVVVVNAREFAGGGLYNTNLGVDRLVFVAVEVETRAGATESQLSRDTHLLFSHEMGHALGLLDEYQVDSSPPDDPDDERNVWAPGAALPELVTYEFVSSTVVTGPPWAPELPVACTDLVPCCGGPRGTSSCDACSALSATGCHIVPAICQDAMWFCASPYFSGCDLQSSCAGDGFTADFQCAPGDCDGQLGAWEGAVYAREGYYRAKRTCRMRELDESVEFCEACALYLRNKVFDFASAPEYERSLDTCALPTRLEGAGLGWP